MKLLSICRRRKGLVYALLVTMAIVLVMQVLLPQLGTTIQYKPSKKVYNDRNTYHLKNPSLATQLLHQNIEAINSSITTLQDKFNDVEAKWEVITAQDVNKSKGCLPLEDPSAVKTPFKFYIYDLPPKFNRDIQVKMSTIKHYAYCYNLNYCGSGEEFYQYSTGKGQQHYTDPMSPNYNISVRNTHQFALETIIHYKLLHSPYRTLDPTKADLFYIPAYTGLTCLSEAKGGNSFVEELFTYLRAEQHQYCLSGKPHFSTLSKIQREQGSRFCGTLKHPDTANITYIAIEKESNPSWNNFASIYGKSTIVAPYPSYIHLIPTFRNPNLTEFNPNISYLINSTEFQLQVPSLAERNVKLFLASSIRRSNHFRAKIIDQFKNQTESSYDNFIQNYKSTAGNDHQRVYIPDIMLKTPECASGHRTTTIPWMHQSVFCLQPPGDSPTRKSFYDAILSGCIPVIFTQKYKTEYPFQQWLDYSQFTFTIDENLISRYGKKVLEIIQGIPQEKIDSMHKRLLRVAKWFQYSMNDGKIQQDTDAVTLILQQLKELYKL